MAASTSQARVLASSSTSAQPDITPVGGPQPPVGHPLASQSDYRNAGKSPMQSSPTQAMTTNFWQAYPNVYSEPYPQNWYYYNPTRHWRSSSEFFATPLPLSPPVLAPRIPSFQSDTTGQSAADSMLERLCASLNALQSQFTSFHKSLNEVNSDIKDSLSQLRTLRIAQNKTERSIVGLEAVIGVTCSAESHDRRAKGRGGTSNAVPGTEGADTETILENTLVQSVASIQSAIRVLLARESQVSQSYLSTDLQQTAISTLLPVNLSEQESLHASSHLTDPHRQSSTSQSSLSSPLSQLSTPTPELSTTSHALSRKEYADASTQAYTFQLSYSDKDTPILTPVDWSAVPAVLRHPVDNIVQWAAFTTEQSGPFSRDTVVVTDGRTSQHDRKYAQTQVPVSSPFRSQSSGTSRVLATLPGTSSPSESLVIPSVNSSELATVPSSRTTTSTHNLSTQASSPTAEVVGPSHQMGAYNDSRQSPPLSSLASTGDVPVSVSGTSTSEDQIHADLPLGVAHATSQVHRDANLTSGGVTILVSGALPIESGFHQHSTPNEADAGEEVSPGLPNPKQYTPAPDSRPAQEEDEVWDALMLSASGVSTPIPDSPSPSLVFSRQPSRTSEHSHSPQPPIASTSALAQELFAATPSMLHDPTLSPFGSGLLNSPQDWGSPLSSLTSLADMEKEEIERSCFKANASASHATSETRDGLGAGTEPLGGPSASLDQLALLARREPLKIHIKLPEWLRGLKRKRDDDEKGDKAGATSDAVGERVGHGTRSSVGKAAREGQPKGTQTRIQVDASSSHTGLVSPGTSRQTRPVPESSISGARKCLDDVSYMPAPRKRTKKRNERVEKKTNATSKTSSHTVRQKGSKRASTAKQRSSSKYHVWSGHIVAVEVESEPSPSPAAEPPQTRGPQPSVPAEEADEKLEPLARARDWSRGENQAMDAPLLSPSTCSTPRGLRAGKSSPMKKGLWDSSYRSSGTWPELPAAFSQWDVQFIQCDDCNNWYHYGCVEIQFQDPRLDPGSLFVCPVCHAQSTRHLTLEHQADKCARPDCPEPRITSDTETFYLEKLVGRKKVEGYLYMWLAKWEGYPMNQATWIPKENIFGDGTGIFNTFVEEALQQGADLSQDLILLREAVDAGWEE